MPPNKRNEFLDVSDSEDDRDNGQDSEAEITKGRQGTKRRKLEHRHDESEDSDIDEAHYSEDGEADDVSEKGQSGTEDDDGADDIKGEDEGDGGSLDGESREDDKPAKKRAPKLHITKPAARKNLITTDKSIKKSGVIYLSRIPPFMKVAKVRSLLEPFGTINRIYLTPEDSATRTRRIRAGGNRKKTFTEGWVEFVSKKDAKRTVELLNARPIGGRKGSWYADDVWTMLYLHGFKWKDLTGQIAAEDAERASRMKAELSKASKSDKEFARNVEKAKQVEGMEKKRKEREPREGHGEEQEEGSAGLSQAVRRTFTQVPLAKKRKIDGEKPSEDVNRVLSKIF